MLAHELAAVIVEPVVQGAGGMHFYSPEVVGLLRALCDQHEILLILDEIATGFGRTGALFACEHAGVSADVMCVGKALSGGYLPLAATLCSPRIAEAISTGDGGALMHGPTFMGNALACAVALASTDLLADGAWRADVARIETGLADGLKAGKGNAGREGRPRARRDRGGSARPAGRRRAATRAAKDRGVWLRPFRDLVYTMPPYVTEDDEIATSPRRSWLRPARGLDLIGVIVGMYRDRYRCGQDDRHRGAGGVGPPPEGSASRWSTPPDRGRPGRTRGSRRNGASCPGSTTCTSSPALKSRWRRRPRPGEPGYAADGAGAGRPHAHYLRSRSDPGRGCGWRARAA